MLHFGKNMRSMVENNYKMRRNTIILCIFILLKFIVQYFAIDAGYNLHRDEYLHIDQGKHLAWGYVSVPPVTSWISYLILLLGSSVLLVKFIPALFGALTIVVVWKSIEELEGDLFALILGATCVLFSALIRLNTLYQPNSLDYLLWAALFFSVLKFINTENHKWLYVASVCFALGFLNKYNITFLILGLLPALLLSPHRKVLLNRHLYLASLIALIIISPNLIWQYVNDFPVFHHLQELSETQLVNVSRLDFLKEQLLFFVGGLFVIVIGLISFFSYTPFKKYQIFFWSYVITIAIFTFFRAKGYYAIGLYPILIAFGSVYLEKLLAKGRVRYLRGIAVIVPVLIMWPLLSLILPVLSPEEIEKNADDFKELGLLRWEDGDDHAMPQDFADMLGWAELASIVDAAFENIEDKERTLVQCDNYGQAGAINYYSKERYTQAVSMNADYKNWYPLDEMEIRNVILVKQYDDKDKNRVKEMPLFEEITLIGEIENKYAREVGTKVYLLRGAKQSINKILQEEMDESKKDD